jgi:hypothetical protein
MKYYRCPEINKYPNSNLEIIKEIKEINQNLPPRAINFRKRGLSFTHTF